MGRAKAPRKVNRYSAEFKVKAEITRSLSTGEPE
jgi:hypothetical protein